MKALALETMRRGREKIKRYLSKRSLILLYHRMAETQSDPWQLAVTPVHFAEHLEVLSRYGRVMPLRKLSRAVRKGKLPRRAAVVTFDDGYADNLFNAKPLLEKYEIPATVFMTTGCIGEDREFWWDELDRLFLQPGALPSELSLRVNGRKYRWELGEMAGYDEANCDRNNSWRAWHENAPTTRHMVYRSLWHLMHPMADTERRQVREELREWAGATSAPRPMQRTLSSDEISELAQGGLIEVGCHTVTHPQLSALKADSQQNEIHKSKTRLEEILAKQIESFAYPYGRECDYTSRTVEIVQQAGFDCACSTSVGVVSEGADRFQLPRLQVQDMNGESFARLLSEWLSD